MTDNGSEFRSEEFEEAATRLHARPVLIRVGQPQANGRVERVQGTTLEEC
ncbi:MAG: hypothetical protein ABSE70_10485 [Candidatus Limnocylindrales bacterium]